MAYNSPQPVSLGEWLLMINAEGPTRTRQGRIAAVMLIATLVLIALGILIYAVTLDLTITDPTQTVRVSIISGVAFALVIAIFFINRRGNTLAAGLSLSVLLLGLNLILLSEIGPLSPAAVALAVPVIIAGLLSPPVGVAVIIFLACFGYALLCSTLLPDYGIRLLADPAYLQSSLVYLNVIFIGVMSWLFARTTHSAVDETDALTVALSNQQEVVEKQLGQQTRYLRSTVQITRSLAGLRELDQLLARAVSLVRDAYKFHHVRLFLLDDEGVYAVLRQSQGDTGPLLAEGEFRHRIGGRSAVGKAIGAKRPFIIRDTRTQLSKEEVETILPGALSVAAFPMMLGNTSIGSLEFQSIKKDDFPEEAIPTLQALCDQLAIAIENARLFQQTQDSLQELTQLGTEVNRLNWAEFLASSAETDTRQVYGTESKILQLHRDRVVERVLTDGVPIASTGADGRQPFLAVPISVRGEVVGVLGVEPPDAREWTRVDVQLLERIAERTSLAVENARLYAQARRSAQRERLINQISARLQTAPSLDLLLEATVQELAQVFGTDNVYTEITLGSTSLPEQPEASQIDGRTVDGTAHPTPPANNRTISLDTNAWQQTQQEEQHD